MLSCVNNNQDMQSWGKTIEIKLTPKKTNKGKKIPLFIFGINSQKEWMVNTSQNPNPLNQIQIFNGLQRIYIPGDIIKRATGEVFINQLLAEYLLIGVVYDLMVLTVQALYIFLLKTCRLLLMNAAVIPHGIW